jgi:hypothetical protein
MTSPMPNPSAHENDRIIVAVAQSPITRRRIPCREPAQSLDRAGVARANVAASPESPLGSVGYAEKHQEYVGYHDFPSTEAGLKSVMLIMWEHSPERSSAAHPFLGPKWRWLNNARGCLDWVSRSWIYSFNLSTGLYSVRRIPLHLT